MIEKRRSRVYEYTFQVTAEAGAGVDDAVVQLFRLVPKIRVRMTPGEFVTFRQQLEENSILLKNVGEHSLLKTK